MSEHIVNTNGSALHVTESGVADIGFVAIDLGSLPRAGRCIRSTRLCMASIFTSFDGSAERVSFRVRRDRK